MDRSSAKTTGTSQKFPTILPTTPVQIPHRGITKCTEMLQQDVSATRQQVPNFILQRQI